MAPVEKPNSSEQTTAPPPWSKTVRVLHWLVVAVIAGAYATAWLAPPSALAVHVWLGGIAGGALVVRLIWGFKGPWWERFSAFPLQPKDLLSHGRHLLAPPAAPTLNWSSHPPLGAAMVVALLSLVGGMVASGLMGYGGQEKSGPFAAWLPFTVGHFAFSVHELLAILLLCAIVGHILGVVIESLRLKVRLVPAMVTGHRDGAVSLPAQQNKPTSPSRLWALAGTSLAVLVAVGWWLAQAAPVPQVTQDASGRALYDRECGACHMAYPPAVLPSRSWSMLLDELSDHFGEDASLPENSVAQLNQWLTSQSAEHWDSKAGYAFQRVAVEHPYQITATPFWRHKHQEIPPEVFRSKAVGNAANCAACHHDVTDAGSSFGFRRAAIDIPH